MWRCMARLPERGHIGIFNRSYYEETLAVRVHREILERECFGLVEFVEPEHGFEVVGGMDEVKKDLLLIASNIRNGSIARVPMGILFTGPMGTGKTFVAEAFAKECGLTTVKLKNFRSKWVGATEGNLERILSVIQAIGQILVIIDDKNNITIGSDTVTIQGAKDRFANLQDLTGHHFKTVIIKADPRASYGTVLQVMDAAKSQDLTQFGLANKPEGSKT